MNLAELILGVIYVVLLVYVLINRKKKQKLFGNITPFGAVVFLVEGASIILFIWLMILASDIKVF